MKKLTIAAAAAVALFAMGASAPMGSTMMMKPTIVPAGSITWTPGTGQLPSTVGVAVLEGDPSKPGPFCIRLNMPDGTKFPAHYHNDTERITVISGTFMAGIGSTYDATKMVALPAGSYVVLPAHLWHFAASKGATIVQVNGSGPFVLETK